MVVGVVDGAMQHPQELRGDPGSPNDRPNPQVSAAHRVDLRVGAKGELRLCLDGTWVRPPWPTEETRRILALGRVPMGRPDEPLEWWVERSHGTVMVDSWRQWVDHGMLVVEWRQWQSYPNFEASETLAFFVEAEFWELVWSGLWG